MTTECNRWICLAWLLLIPVAGNAATPKVATGGAHTVALKNNGTLVAVGDDSTGQLGLGRLLQSSTPVQTSGVGQILAIDAGLSHTVALRQDGTVWTWGDNLWGQLGDGSFTSRGTPAPVPGLTGVVAIAAGESHTLALKQDGTVWAWGSNLFGQLGDGTTTSRSTPVQVTGLTGVVSISAGEFHSVALKQDGTAWAWGGNIVGQLGDGTYESRREPVVVVNENVNGFLDLIPEVPNNVPPDKIPPFFLATYKSGGLTTTSLSADIRGITPIGSFALATGVAPLAADGYHVYVAASAPNSGSYVYYQLDSNNYWSVLTWPMADFLRGVELGSQDALIRVNILQNVDLSPYIGTSILVGYGTDPDEMVRNARYRTIFTVAPPL